MKMSNTTVFPGTTTTDDLIVTDDVTIGGDLTGTSASFTAPGSVVSARTTYSEFDITSFDSSADPIALNGTQFNLNENAIAAQVLVDPFLTNPTVASLTEFNGTHVLDIVANTLFFNVLTTPNTSHLVELDITVFTPAGTSASTTKMYSVVTDAANTGTVVPPSADAFPATIVNGGILQAAFTNIAGAVYVDATIAGVVGGFQLTTTGLTILAGPAYANVASPSGRWVMNLRVTRSQA